MHFLFSHPGNILCNFLESVVSGTELSGDCHSFKDTCPFANKIKFSSDPET